MKREWISNFYTGGMEHIIFFFKHNQYAIINDEGKTEFIGTYAQCKAKQERMEREDWAERIC